MTGAGRNLRRSAYLFPERMGRYGLSRSTLEGLSVVRLRSGQRGISEGILLRALCPSSPVSLSDDNGVVLLL